MTPKLLSPEVIAGQGSVPETSTHLLGANYQTSSECVVSGRDAGRGPDLRSS